MTIENIIQQIVDRHKGRGIHINPPATLAEISAFEKQVGFALPADFVEFYSICNGFGCTEDIFNIAPLSEIRCYPQDHGANWFYFSEYMIYSDMWGLRLTDSGNYEIFNGSYPTTPMTSSLKEFLSRFLQGDVFEPGGLYDWHEELKIKSR
jgi:hypothetical protein